MNDLMRDAAAALAVLFFAMMFGFIKPARAADLTPTQAVSLYAMASGLSGIVLAERAPDIMLVPASTLRAMACPHKDADRCPVFGLFTRGKIWLDATLDFADPYASSILLHEMVHYLQDARDGLATTCEEWERREAQAYQVQVVALARAGADTMRVRLNSQLARCS